MNKNSLSKEDYKTQLRLSLNSPIATADYIPVKMVDGVRWFLLAQRAEQPYKGEYFVSGGKIIGNETPKQAARRNLRRELGIALSDDDLEFVDHLPVRNPPKLGQRWNSLWHFYLAHIPAADIALELNYENRRAMWFSAISRRWPLPVCQALLAAKFQYREDIADENARSLASLMTDI